MSILKDRKFEQSILVVIAVIGLTGWIGLTFLVRGEVLKQRALPYIQSCEVVGISAWRTMTVHLLPNITGPILISFTFGVAGAILSESGLSFLGFGVQPADGELGRAAAAGVRQSARILASDAFPRHRALHRGAGIQLHGGGVAQGALPALRRLYSSVRLRSR